MNTGWKIYFILIHILIISLIIESGIIRKAVVRVGLLKEVKPEYSKHYSNMVNYYKSVDQNTSEDSILFFGDSSIQNLSVAAINKDGVNFGIGEETTLGLLNRLREYQSLKTARIVVLSIGYNDLKFRENDDIYRNIVRIVNTISQKIPILISSIAPVDEIARPDLAGLNQYRIAPLNQLIKNFCLQQRNLQFIDTPTPLIDNDGNLDPRYHVGDGIHRNSEGNRIWILALSDAISRSSKDKNS